MTITFCVTRVKELMTPHPGMISPTATLQQAAKKMESADCGALPVGADGILQGIITDRDIVIRALAHGQNPAVEKVGSHMSKTVYACYENDTLEEASEIMRQHNVSRLIVRNRRNEVTGMLFFGNILRHDADAREIAGVLKHCCGPVAV